MHWIHLITLLSLLQLFGFSIAVGRAREKYGVKAPAMSGHEIFDRYFRVQMNTVELIVLFLPALYVAANYWGPLWIALIGCVYLIGRHLYFLGYIDPAKKRTLGFGLSMIPILILVILGLIGIVRVAAVS
jgi:glutathione S-transferase